MIFRQTSYNVDRVLQKKPIALVYAMSNGSKRKVIKIYPKPEDRALREKSVLIDYFEHQTARSFQKFLASTQFFSSQSNPEATRTCLRVADSVVNSARHNVDGEMLFSPENVTGEAMTKAIRYLDRIHELSVLHADVHQFRIGIYTVERDAYEEWRR